MSILDDAIREHLELKRAHGADEGDVQKLEDEAFGPPQRPDQVDPFAEAPTEFLLSPSDAPAGAPEVGDEAERGGRRPNITDLQEAPPPTPPEGTEAPAGPADAGAGDAAPDEAGGALFDADAPSGGAEDSAPVDAAPPAPSDAAAAPALAPDEELSPAPDAPPPSPTDAADVPLPPPADEMPAPSAPAEPADEEHPAGEYEVIADPGPSTEARHAIADQPTQMFDVQAHVDAEAAEATAAEEAPSDEELVAAAQSEPRAAPPAPEDQADAAPSTEIDEQPPLDTRGPDAEVAGHPPAAAEEESAEFDFFNEQRLSDELDQALEAPITDEHGLPRYDDSASAQGGIFDFESQRKSYEDDPSEEVLRRMDEPASEELPHAFDPPSEEASRDRPEQPSEEAPREQEPPSEETPRGSAEPPSEEGDIDYDPDTGHEDVLEDTPRFLEDAPEDDDLWFEQKPPKDFDLD
jgi:hypothetical protein